MRASRRAISKLDELFAMGAHTLGEEQFRGYVHLWRATSRAGRTKRSCRNKFPNRIQPRGAPAHRPYAR